LSGFGRFCSHRDGIEFDRSGLAHDVKEPSGDGGSLLRLAVAPGETVSVRIADHVFSRCWIVVQEQKRYSEKPSPRKPKENRPRRSKEGEGEGVFLWFGNRSGVRVLHAHTNGHF
jgi:hypothetical protein